MISLVFPGYGKTAKAADEGSKGRTTASRQLEDLFTTIDLMDADIASLQKEMEAGNVTSAELTQMYIDRINAYDKQLDLNSIISIDPAALDNAKAMDQERLEGKVRGPLHGIPVVIKANIDIAGMPTSAASKALSGMTASEDAFIVKKLKDAGAVILAQANMSEFALYAVNSRSSLGGIVHNAYDVSKTPMGSSGGTAVAVTSNFAAAGIGTDTGGSIRNPSSVSNLYGFKPSKGLTSVQGVFPLITSRDTTGPMARTAEDMALMLEVIAGTDAGDDFTQEADADAILGDGFLDSLSPDALKGMRIGFLEYSFSLTYTNKETEDESGKSLLPAGDRTGSFGLEIMNPFDSRMRMPVSGNAKPAGKEAVTVLPDPKIEAMLQRTLENLRNAGAEFVDLSEYLPYSKLEELNYYYEDGRSFFISDDTMEYDINRFLHEKGDASPYGSIRDMYIANPDLPNLSDMVLSLCPENDPDKCDPASYLAESFETTRDPYTVTVGSYRRTPGWPHMLRSREAISQILQEQKIDAVMYLTFRDVSPDETESTVKNTALAGYNYIFGSIFGFPDISLPMGFSDPSDDYPSEMPLALSIFSDFGNDEKLVKIAYAYEQQAGKSIRRMPENTPALPDPALNAFMENLTARAYTVDYAQYGKTPGCKAQQMLDACRRAENTDRSDPYAVYEAARDLAAAYDAVMDILLNDGAEDPACPRPHDRPGFFRLEGELPATGITAGSGCPISEKPASVKYRPLDMELMIPTLDLKSEIVALTAVNGRYPVEWLGDRTGWLEGSACPGEGISVLAAHNTLNAEEYGPFARISAMREGDRFSLLSPDSGLMTFEVYASRTIGADDMGALEKTASLYENTLTLLTCEDELPEGGYASRRIVSARKLEDF